MEDFFWIGLIMLLGYISKILSEKFNFPKITIYLLLGIFLSQSVSSIIPKTFIEHTGWIIDFSLVIIAFIIGGSIKFKEIIEMKKSILYITVFQAQFAFIITTIGLYFILPFLIQNNNGYSDFIFYFSISLFLGALASTTAPTTTLAVIEEYKSVGIVTTTLLAVVAIDDILAIVNYSLSLSIYSSVVDTINTNYLRNILELLYHIMGSAFIGVSFALFTIFIISKVHSKNTLSIAIGNILLVYSISSFLDFEALLAVMIFGLTLSNRSDYFEYIFKHLEKNYLDVIFMLFFIVTGASVDLGMLFSMWDIAIIYVLLRGFGKYFGSYIGANISKARKEIRENIGLALIPQAGVALGLAMLLYKEFPLNQITQIVLNTILATTIIHEIIGPFLTKFALKRAGEIKEKSEDKIEGK
ncbi:MAG: cation:proton antiporter [Campylobacterota bacterium]|nr:cation:proton antiporter [Campylobacterota bacterium]